MPSRLGWAWAWGPWAAPMLHTLAHVSVSSESPGLVFAYETAPRPVWSGQAAAPQEAHGRPVHLGGWGAGLMQPLCRRVGVWHTPSQLGDWRLAAKKDSSLGISAAATSRQERGTPEEGLNYHHRVQVEQGPGAQHQPTGTGS